MSENFAINMDRTQRVVIDTLQQPWIGSPAEGVMRKPLEREAAERGQVTSIVQFAAGSSFSPHTHPMGEEILVLSGVFEDEHAAYPAGTYLRNPPGSYHRPRSGEGCEILVKLDMFNENDLELVVIDTYESTWHPGLVDGLSVMPLHDFNGEGTALVKWEAGTKFNPHTHPGGEEVYVIEGTFEDEEGRYPQGTWLRSPPYSRHHPFSTEGCVILVKTGHIYTLSLIHI